MFGVRAGRSSSCAYYYYYRYYYYYIRWVVTVGSTGYGCPHRRVRIGARFWGPGHVTYIVPYSALPLDPSMCVLTPRESPPPPTSCYTALSIYTNSRVFCRCTLKWFVLAGTSLHPGTAAVVCLGVLVGAVALDVSGLTTLVARGERARCEWMIGWLARVGAPVIHPIWVGEWGCTTGIWGRSAAMWKLTDTSPFHPERVGPSCMARFFEADAAGVCVALILSVNQSAVSLRWFWAMTRSYSMTRSATTSCSPSSWEYLDARRSH